LPRHRHAAAWHGPLLPRRKPPLSISGGCRIPRL